MTILSGLHARIQFFEPGANNNPGTARAANRRTEIAPSTARLLRPRQSRTKARAGKLNFGVKAQATTFLNDLFRVSPLRHAPFRRFYFGSIGSALGYTMQATVAAWLMATLTPSALMVALVQTASTAPALLFGLIAGALADIVERRHHPGDADRALVPPRRWGQRNWRAQSDRRRSSRSRS